jgi:hypothetical protein
MEDALGGSTVACDELQLAGPISGAVRNLGRRWRVPITIVGTLAVTAGLALLLAGRRHEFATAFTGAAAWVLATTILLQIVALLARSEAWHICIGAAGGSVDRRLSRSWPR